MNKMLQTGSHEGRKAGRQGRREDGKEGWEEYRQTGRQEGRKVGNKVRRQEGGDTGKQEGKRTSGQEGRRAGKEPGSKAERQARNQAAGQAGSRRAVRRSKGVNMALSSARTLISGDEQPIFYLDNMPFRALRLSCLRAISKKRRQVLQLPTLSAGIVPDSLHLHHRGLWYRQYRPSRVHLRHLAILGCPSKHAPFSIL